MLVCQWAAVAEQWVVEAAESATESSAVEKRVAVAMAAVAMVVVEWAVSEDLVGVVA